MIYLIGCIIACFLAVLMLLKKDKKRADHVFAGWLCVLSAHISLFYMYHTGLSYELPHTLGLLLPLPVLHGFFLYIYTQSLTDDRVLKPQKLVLYLLPFILLVVLAIPFYGLSAQEKIQVFKNDGKGFEWFSIIQLTVIVVSGYVYSIASIRKIHKHRTSVFTHFSNNNKQLLNWLQYLAIGLGAIWTLAIFFEESIIFTAVVLLVLFIGFFGLNQVPIVYTNRNVHDSTLEIVSEVSDPEYQTSEKYAKTGLKEDEIPQIMGRLEAFMRLEKPFQDGDLTLDDLALRFNLAPNQLSQVINSVTGKTFYHYINMCRIQEFLQIAQQPQNKKYTFLALAYDCGFNSKSTFNKYFKLQTGKTPSEYFDATTLVEK